MSNQVFWVAAIVLGLTGFGSPCRPSGPAPIVLGGVEYRAEHEQDGVASSPKASIVALEPRTNTMLWRVELDQGTSRGAWLGGRNYPRVVALAPFARGLIASTSEGKTFFVDPTTRQSQVVRDMRSLLSECSEHHRPMVGRVVPIHYGLAWVQLRPSESKGSDPGFEGPIEGGCCVMPETAALVSSCPECPSAGR